MAKMNRIFPKNPADGDAISDKFGNVYEYDAQTDSWAMKGKVVSPDIVTESNAGLILPSIYKRLQYLRTVKNQADLTSFKIEPASDSYWYYFRSPSGLIRFEVEDPNTIRLEIDRGRLTNLFLKKTLHAYGNPTCPTGAKGLPGDQGRTGPKGINGGYLGVEPYYLPTTAVRTLTFATIVPTPIDTPISVRLYRTGTGITSQAAEPFLIENAKRLGIEQYRESLELNAFNSSIKAQSFSLSPVFTGTSETVPSFIIEVDSATSKYTVIKSLYDIDRGNTSFVYDDATGILSGTITLSTRSWGPNWSIKTTQKGPIGDVGDDAACFLTPVGCDVTNHDIQALCPIVNVRLECNTNVIRTFCYPLSDALCTSRIAFAPNSESISDLGAEDGTFAAAKVGLDECKDVYQYSFTPGEAKTPNLVLADWAPQPGCVTKRHYDKQKFDWTPNTNMAGCNQVAIWLSPTDLRGTKYPWTNITQAEPERDLCCQDDFFYCPNLQTQECPKPAARVVPPRMMGIGLGYYFGMLMFDGKSASVAIASLFPEQPLKIISTAVLSNATTAMNLRLDAVPVKAFTADTRMNLTLYGNEGGVASEIDLNPRLKIMIANQAPTYRMIGESTNTELYKPAKMSGLETGSIIRGRFTSEKTADFPYTNPNQPYMDSEELTGFRIYTYGEASVPDNNVIAEYVPGVGIPSTLTDGFSVRANVDLNYNLWQADDV